MVYAAAEALSAVVFLRGAVLAVGFLAATAECRFGAGAAFVAGLRARARAVEPAADFLATAFPFFGARLARTTFAMGSAELRMPVMRSALADDVSTALL